MEFSVSGLIYESPQLHTLLLCVQRTILLMQLTELPYSTSHCETQQLAKQAYSSYVFEN